MVATTTLHNIGCEMFSTSRPFAAILRDGTVVTWGRARFGGAVRRKINIQASETAFAAILADGSVVTWGDDDHGGDSRAVQHHLST